MNKDPRKWERTSWEKANTIPCEPGCYALLDSNDNILYIGRSKILWNRLHDPSRHTGFNRTKQNVRLLTISWCAGWDAYDSEKVLIDKWIPSLSQDRITGKG